ncbi:hypothetical protein T492DRAFT_1037097 [Pavlovales sp. CCMP2436]|nr:hypothetical protein T492DRAFT_1037097 [Pavlovales sp. CCMP2436]|mmetsp:Transcript_1883/g.4896  ORF Transcript_1883/g.4896 Transcript_1883/m.4896 type:complete len:354 (+) Transcript_1883:321-1382(+)
MRTLDGLCLAASAALLALTLYLSVASGPQPGNLSSLTSRLPASSGCAVATPAAAAPMRVAKGRAWPACATALGCGDPQGNGSQRLDAAVDPHRWACGAMARLQLAQCVPHSRLLSAMAAARSSCAVVGSSSALVGAGLGAEIDAHSVVLRANLAPLVTDGAQEPPFRGSSHTLRLNAGDYRRDVGSRTSGRLLNRMHAVTLVAEVEAGTAAQYEKAVRNFVGDPEPIELLVTHAKAFTNALRRQRYSLRCAPRLLEPSNRTAQPWPTSAQPAFPSALVLPLPQVTASASVTSSGIVAVLLALQLCSSLMAYGFGQSSRAGFAEGGGARHGARFHYYQVLLNAGLLAHHLLNHI